MYDTAITLICNPESPLLDNEFSGGFSCFLDMQHVGAVHRSILAYGVANDFFCNGGVGDESFKTEIKNFIGDRPIDFAIQPSEHRRKRLLIADMDSTIIQQECIDELAEFAGKRAEISDITERAMRGELDFEAALKERVAMLKGLPESMVRNRHILRNSLIPVVTTLGFSLASLAFYFAGSLC